MSTRPGAADSASEASRLMDMLAEAHAGNAAAAEVVVRFMARKLFDMMLRSELRLSIGVTRIDLICRELRELAEYLAGFSAGADFEKERARRRARNRRRRS